MLVFLLDCLRFSKLLKLHQTEGRISNNLLKRKQSSRKTSIVCRWLSLFRVNDSGSGPGQTRDHSGRYNSSSWGKSSSLLSILLGKIALTAPIASLWYRCRVHLVSCFLSILDLVTISISYASSTQRASSGIVSLLAIARFLSSLFSQSF